MNVNLSRRELREHIARKAEELIGILIGNERAFTDEAIVSRCNEINELAKRLQV